jgi:hypothetical protein
MVMYENAEQNMNQRWFKALNKTTKADKIISSESVRAGRAEQPVARWQILFTSL